MIFEIVGSIENIERIATRPAIRIASGCGRIMVAAVGRS
jgi:hypothetical protein